MHGKVRPSARALVGTRLSSNHHRRCTQVREALHSENLRRVAIKIVHLRQLRKVRCGTDHEQSGCFGAHMGCAPQPITTWCFAHRSMPALDVGSTRRVSGSFQVSNAEANMAREMKIHKKLKHKNVVELIEDFRIEEKDKW